MKNLKLFSFLLVCMAVLAMSCEGPMGPAGADGTDGTDGSDGSDGTPGVDGNVTCLVCHSAAVMGTIEEQFSRTSHAIAEIGQGRGSWSGSCVKCHTSQGFIEYATDGTTGGGLVADAFECKTCHGLHTTFTDDDYALRLTDAVDFIFDETVSFDAGNGNLCANCHQSRRAEPNVTNPGTDFTITSTHYGPHHGAQANVLHGSGFAEIPGTIAYPTAESDPHMTPSCTGCHLDTYDHGFNPSLDACNSCHTTADFNYGNVQAETQILLDDLRDLLEAAGVIAYEAGDYYELNEETGIIELVTAAGGYHPVPGTYPMAEVQAFFNWTGLDEDRSLGVHNPKYVKALLTNSIEALTP